MANGINTVSDPCLIYCFWIFPEIGVTGAADATNFGGSIGVLYGPYHRVGAMGRLQLGQQDIALRLKIVGSLVQISAGGGGPISGGDCQLRIFDVSCVRLRERCCRELHHFGEGPYVQHPAGLGSE